MSVILLVSVFLMTSLRRTPAALRHGIWALSLLGVMLPPLCYGVVQDLRTLEHAGFGEVKPEAKIFPRKSGRTRREVAEELEESLKARRFEVIVEQFDPELKKALPAAELEKLWQKLIDSYGEPLHSRIDCVNYTKRFGTAWFWSIEYWLHGGELEVRFTFDDQSRINGLWISADREHGIPGFPKEGYQFGNIVKKAAEANLSLKGIAVGLDGKVTKKRSVSIWMAVESEKDDGYVTYWHDSATGKTWQWISFNKAKYLSPGLYRIVALGPYTNSPPPIGMSDPIELDGSQEHTEVKVQMQAGPSLALRCVDAKTGKPSVPQYITVTCKSNHLPPGTHFESKRFVSSITFENMPPGTYTIDAHLRAPRPDKPEYRLIDGPMEIKVVAGEDQEITLPIRESLMTEEAIAKRWPCVATGRVMDKQGQPMEGVSIRANSGVGTLPRTGITETGKDGRYTLRFSAGGTIAGRDPKTGEIIAHPNVAYISAVKTGFAEKNTSMFGRMMASGYQKTRLQCDFVMIPAATVDIELIDAEGKPVTERALCLSGGNYRCKKEKNQEGRFHFEDVPSHLACQFYAAFNHRQIIRTPEMNFSQPEKYQVRLRLYRDAKSDEGYLDVISVKNVKGEEVLGKVLTSTTAVKKVVYQKNVEFDEVKPETPPKLSLQDCYRQRREVAKGLVGLLKEKRFQEVVSQFDPELKKMLPASKVEELWKQLVDAYGVPLRGRHYGSERFGTVQFERIESQWIEGRLIIRLAFDPQCRINGIWVSRDIEDGFADFPSEGYLFGDAVKEAAKADLSLKAVVLGLDGKPIKRSASLWMAVDGTVDPEARDWRDSASRKTWRRIDGNKHLVPGVYRASSRSSWSTVAPPPVGLSKPVELDGNQKETEVTVRMIPGPTLTFKPVNAKTGEPVPRPGITLTCTSDHLPPGTKFSPDWSDPSMKLENVPPGTYSLDASLSAPRPDKPEYRLEDGPIEVKVVAGEDQEITLPIREALMTEKAIAKRWPWVVQGRVTDEKGQPLEGVSVTAYSGYWRQWPSGHTETDKDGRYTLRFTGGGHGRTRDKKTGEWSTLILPAGFSIRKSGFVEKDLNRHGSFTIADRLPTPDELENCKDTPKSKLILPNSPTTIDFTMVPAATVDVELVDVAGKPVSVAEKTLGISGEKRSPGCSVLKSGEKVDAGCFHVEDVPPNYPWWFYLHTTPRQKARTPEMTFSEPEKYRVQLRLAERASSGEEYLEVVSVKNAQGEEVRERVLADSTKSSLRPGVDKVAPPELVAKLLETNRPWLKPDPKYLSYTFHMEHPGKEDPMKYTVQYAAPNRAIIREVGSGDKLGYNRMTVLQGVSMFGPLQALAVLPRKSHILTIVGEEKMDGVDTWVLHLKKAQSDQDSDARFSVAAGCGLARTWYGYSSYKVDLDQVWVDKATGCMVREEAFTKEDGFYKKTPSFVATYADFEKTPDGGQVPRQVEVRLQSNPSSPWVFKMDFRLVDKKAWLLKELKLSQGDQENVAVATVTDASTTAFVVDPPAVKLTRVYKPLPGDEKLTEMQSLFCRWDAKILGLPDMEQWDTLNEEEKATMEAKFLEQLSSRYEPERIEAIKALTALDSKKAVAPILKIAAERKEKNNADRQAACRALGVLGDRSVVPELVHLTYHYNWNTRNWAKISLVRLTGQTFGCDVKAWKQWWEEQGGQTPISSETVVWGTSPEMAALASPEKQEESDRRMVEKMKQRLGED